jgi:ATP/maltotriose-dependent transcriptional regulator MalT
MAVMRLVVSGLLNKQVADELGITESTVKAQRDVVMQKMKARARKRALLGPRWFRRKQLNSFEVRPGDMGDTTYLRHR